MDGDADGESGESETRGIDLENPLDVAFVLEVGDARAQLGVRRTSQRLDPFAGLPVEFARAVSRRYGL